MIDPIKSNRTDTKALEKYWVRVMCCTYYSVNDMDQFSLLQTDPIKIELSHQTFLFSSPLRFNFEFPLCSQAQVYIDTHLYFVVHEKCFLSIVDCHI